MKKILIAEDEVDLSEAMRLALVRASYTVDIAGNGTEAIKKLSTKDYNLLLTDLLMPEMDGFAVAEWVKKNKPALPMIVLSNLSDDASRKKLEDLGVKDFFVKSDMPMRELVEKTKGLLG